MNDRPEPPKTGAAGLRLVDLADCLGGAAEGDVDLLIRDVSNVNDAVEGAIVRVESARYLEAAQASAAAALLVPAGLEGVRKACIRVTSVRRAFVRCLELFSRESLPPPGVHPGAVVGSGVEMGGSCSIGPGVVVGDRARLGPRVVLCPHVVVGEEVEIGEESVLFPHVTVYARSVIGARVRIHAGAVIGADGFGYEWTGRQHAKMAHNGRVRIGDDVEIGANATIDRATTGETVIGPGTKIDNLVQIAHNVEAGAHCLIAAQAGVAGSSSLGNGVVLAGQVGVSDHVHLADGVQAGAQSGIVKDQPAGAAVSGYYSRPHREHLQIQAALSQLPGLLRRVRELEARLGSERVETEE